MKVLRSFLIAVLFLTSIRVAVAADLSLLSGVETWRFEAINPGSFADLPREKLSLPIAIDLGRHLSAASPGMAACALVSLTPSELNTVKEDSYLLIQAARNLRIWAGGRPFFNSVQLMPAEPIALPLPEGAEILQFLTCSANSSGALFFKLQVKSKTELKRLCAERKTSWRYAFPSHQRCAFKLAGNNQSIYGDGGSN